MTPALYWTSNFGLSDTLHADPMVANLVIDYYSAEGKCLEDVNWAWSLPHWMVPCMLPGKHRTAHGSNGISFSPL